jgi:hypothetical protein
MKGIRKSAGYTYPLTIRINVPQIAPARLLSIQPKTTNTPMSLLFFRLISPDNALKASSGMRTCHRSARDHVKFTGTEKPPAKPEPTIQPI